jgi:GDP-L-fucose synthase
VLPALIRKMHLGKCLMTNDWEGIRKDVGKKPIEGVDGNAKEEAILEKLNKYGIFKKGNGVSVTLWGTGSPLREFLHSDDMADACVFLMENVDFKDLVENRKKAIGAEAAKEIRNTHINIGRGTDLTIKHLAEKVKHIVGFEGELIWDASKPDGTMQKLLNVDKLHSLGWKEKISLDDGISSIYGDYIK